MKAAEYLESIQQEPICCYLGETVMEIAKRLSDHNIGAMPVLASNNKLSGMISERDIVHRLSKSDAFLNELKVDDLLTKEVIFMGPNAELSDVKATMSSRGFRHVPIISEGTVLGIISIRDLMDSGDFS